jgi:hypothetical protein
VHWLLSSKLHCTCLFFVQAGGTATAERGDFMCYLLACMHGLHCVHLRLVSTQHHMFSRRAALACLRWRLSCWHVGYASASLDLTAETLQPCRSSADGAAVLQLPVPGSALLCFSLCVAAANGATWRLASLPTICTLPRKVSCWSGECACSPTAGGIAIAMQSLLPCA